MKVMLPTIIGLFSNITDNDYKAQFKAPCEFNQMLDLFSSLPPYFNEIGKTYDGRTDLIAYYSMQLSSTFLVNKNALTMKCLYQMLDLQTRIGGLSINIMDHPEKNSQLVGVMGKYTNNARTWWQMPSRETSHFPLLLPSRVQKAF